MAEIYRRIGGKKIEKLIAMHSTVQSQLDEEALFYGAKAEGLLNTKAKHRTHTSTIQVEEGKVDRYVILDDTNGLDAALSIEYGRKGFEDKNGEWHGATEGLFVLHDAFGLRSPRRLNAKPKRGGDNFRE